LAAHPAPDKLDAAYLRTLLAPKTVADVVNERWAQMTAWAADFARGTRQAEGDVAEQVHYLLSQHLRASGSTCG
jgi:hypothetical protein